MLENTGVVAEIRKAQDFRDAKTEIAKRRLVSELPETNHTIVEILGKDPKSTELLTFVENHLTQNERGKVNLEKQKIHETVLFAHFYDRTNKEIDKKSINSITNEKPADFKVGEDTFQAFLPYAIDYDGRISTIESEINKNAI